MPHSFGTFVSADLHKQLTTAKDSIGRIVLPGSQPEATRHVVLSDAHQFRAVHELFVS